jgi:parvulin-like peptidyl-prolyl isomerase
MRVFVGLTLVSLLLVVPANAQTAQSTPPPAAPQEQAQQPPAPAPVAPAAPAAAPGAPLVTQTEVLESVVVRVNGEIFTKSDLEARQIATLRARGQNLSPEQLEKALAEIMPEMLLDTVDEMLIMQRGKELNYRVSDEQFKRVLDNIRKENKLEDDAQFEAAMKQEGMDLVNLRKNIERSMIMNQVQQVEIMSRIAVSEAEATKYYDEHKSEFTTPAQVTLRELSISVPTDGTSIAVGQDEAAKAKAQAALDRARKGESFEALVKELSDSPSKTSGGLVGPVGPDELVADVRKLIEPLKPGDLTDVFRTRSGWAFLKLESATKSEVKTLDQAREEISEKIYQTKRAGEVAKYLQKLRTQAMIDWKNKELKDLYDKGIENEAKKLAGKS